VAAVAVVVAGVCSGNSVGNHLAAGVQRERESVHGIWSTREVDAVHGVLLAQFVCLTTPAMCILIPWGMLAL